MIRLMLKVYHTYVQYMLTVVCARRCSACANPNFIRDTMGIDTSAERATLIWIPDTPNQPHGRSVRRCITRMAIITPQADIILPCDNAT